MSNTTPTVLGSVVSLWRYPVKSMLGEELHASEVTPRGLLGDRAYALIDGGDGKVASAKNPRKWPQLFDCRAAFIEEPRPGAPVQTAPKFPLPWWIVKRILSGMYEFAEPPGRVVAK